jgi:hypothetical protein
MKKPKKEKVHVATIDDFLETVQEDIEDNPKCNDVSLSDIPIVYLDGEREYRTLSFYGDYDRRGKITRFCIDIEKVPVKKSKVTNRRPPKYGVEFRGYEK